MSNRNILFAVIVIVAVSFAVWYAQGGKLTNVRELLLEDEQERVGVLHIGDATISVDIADTNEARARGLSGRESLPEDSGLFFIFEEQRQHGIWMKDMHFPIDIIWLTPVSDTSSSGGGEAVRIVDIKRDAAPESYPEIFYPKEPALYVLEVNAGFVEQHAISVGDIVQLPLQ